MTAVSVRSWALKAAAVRADVSNCTTSSRSHSAARRPSGTWSCAVARTTRMKRRWTSVRSCCERKKWSTSPAQLGPDRVEHGGLKPAGHPWLVHTLPIALVVFTNLVLVWCILWNIQHVAKVYSHGWLATMGLTDASTQHVVATLIVLGLCTSCSSGCWWVWCACGGTRLRRPHDGMSWSPRGGMRIDSPRSTNAGMRCVRTLCSSHCLHRSERCSTVGDLKPTSPFRT